MALTYKQSPPRLISRVSIEARQNQNLNRPSRLAGFAWIAMDCPPCFLPPQKFKRKAEKNGRLTFQTLHSKQTMDDQNDARDGGRRQGRGDNGSAPQAIPDDEPALDGYAR